MWTFSESLCASTTSVLSANYKCSNITKTTIYHLHLQLALSPYPRLVVSQPQPHPHSSLVGVNHRVVVDRAMIAQTNRSIVRLVHTKENIDRI